MIRSRPDTSRAREAGADPVLDAEPVEIGERGAGVGAMQLDRSSLDILVTGIIGGIEVSFGGLAGATVIGAMLDISPSVRLYTALSVAALVFPIGFVFVILGRSELFTENFLIPVVAVVQRRGAVRQLALVWGLSLAGNMIGCAVLAAIINIPHALGAPVISGYAHYADYKLSLPPLGTFVSAVLAGAIMTVLTWLLLSVRGTLAKLVVIWAAGYTLFATNVSHVVVGAALIFAGVGHTGHAWSEVPPWIGITTAGNVVGGLGFVTLFRLVQVWEQRRT